MLAHKRKIITKQKDINKNKNKRQKEKKRKKQKQKKIKTNMVQLHKVLLEFMWHLNRQGSLVT